MKKRIISADYFKMTLYSANIALEALPGQFVEMKASDSLDPLLRRPLGIHRVQGKTFDILCNIVGKGTRILSEKKEGDYVDVIGPLGNGFDLAVSCGNRQAPIIVAGGMGVAPMVFLAEKLMEARSTVLIGARTKNHILCVNEFKDFGCRVKVATDDGSRGHKGRVTELLNNFLRSTINQERPTIYACGPEPMLKEVSRVVKEYAVPAQISLEAHMSCGIGACLGCVVQTKDGFKRVCKEGPVFNAEEIVWEEL